LFIALDAEQMGWIGRVDSHVRRECIYFYT
jgi:hypothetical protein